MIFREEVVPLEMIDSDDVAYRITTNPCTQDLRRSIATVGLISPPILYEKSGCYRIVSGFRRLAVCRHLGRRKAPMRILSDDADAMFRAHLAVAENALQRPLNLIEQSRAYHLLAAAFVDPACICAAAAAAGLPAHPGLIEKIMPLCCLPDEIQKNILAGTLSLAMAVELRRHDMTTAAELVQLFEKLKLGLNRQREVLNLLEEIAGRDDLRVSELLNEPRIRAVVSDPNATPAQMSQGLIDDLKKRRYPKIYQKTAEFHAAIERLALGGGIRLDPPKNFEAGTYTLSIAFSTLEEFTDRCARLGSLIDDPNFKTLLER